jgi:hypothetical protein
MNDGEASRVFVGDDAEILNTPSLVDVQIKQIKTGSYIFNCSPLCVLFWFSKNNPISPI